MRAKLQSLLRRVIRNVVPELRTDTKSFRYLLGKRAVEASVEFVEKHMLHAEPFETREGLYRFVMERMPRNGLVLEFGVHNGDSINAIAGLTDRIVHGFDSFEGLPDDATIPGFNSGGVKWYAGKMSIHGQLPDVHENVRLHKGWFDQVLPGFYEQNKEPLALLHIDSDIYSSAKFVLECSRDRIKPETIIIFDEYMNFEGWQRHEHRAFTEFVAATGMRYEFIAYTYLGAASIRVLGFDGNVSR